jgi:pimeloyl-ACP methyl ester carboxylesterase
MPDYLEEPRFSDLPVRGGRLRVAIWGQQAAADGTAVIAVHGLTMSHRTWAPVAARLPGLMIVAPDLRGRGASSHLPAPYGIGQHASDVKATLDHLGVKRVVAVGHAMGGYVCEKLAARYPELVSELVLVDGGLTPEPPVGVEIDEFIEQFLGPSLRRLDSAYPSRSHYHSFWRDHPAFAGPPANWNQAIESFVDYDLEGIEPTFRSRTVGAAVRQDFADGRFDERTRQTAFSLKNLPITLLRADRGILNQRPGLISETLLAEYREHLPQLEETFLPEVNHYTITLADPGLTAVVNAVRGAAVRNGGPVVLQ